MERVHNDNILISHDQIKQRVTFLGAEISKEVMQHHPFDLVVVGVLKGSFIFMADLIRELSVPCEIDFVETSSYGEGTLSSGSVLLKRDIQLDIQGRDLLLVEDIVDTGYTVSFLLDHFRVKKPRSMAVCALLYKPARKVKEVPIDFLGFTIEDHFVVGYGLDYNNKCRELKDIMIYKE